MPNSNSSADLPSYRSDVLESQCPNCNRPVVCAEANAGFDSHGFESYDLDCDFCQTPLHGIVDPLDNALLLTAGASGADCLRRSA
jgi:hypothetical protein